jgi:hypothetical protein
MAERLLEALQAVNTGYDTDDNSFQGNAKAAAAVRAFLAPPRGGGAGQQRQQPQQQQSAPPPSSSSPAPPASQRAARAPYVPPPLPSFTSSLSHAPQPPPPQQPRPPSPAQAPTTTTTTTTTTAATAVVDGRRVALEQAEAQLAIFKRGGRIRARPPDGSNGNGNGGNNGGGHASLLDLFERRVANCLSCGKVFDGREGTPEIVAFVNRGGACDFCGAQVALTYAAAREQSMAIEGAAGAAGAGGVGGEGDASAQASTAAARDLKDRLVTYDRESARRTTVLDDQSDFYEVSQLEGDAWASEDDRAAARARAEIERAAEAEAEARRRKFSVTLDLLGRRVLRAEPAPGGGEQGVGIEIGGGAARIPELAAKPAAPARQQQQPPASRPPPANAAGTVTAEALERAYESVANLRIRPVDGGDSAAEGGGGRPRVRYVPSAAAGGGGRGGGRGAGGRGGGGRGGGRGRGDSSEAASAQLRSARIQDDSAFAELEGVLLYDQVAAGG